MSLKWPAAPSHLPAPTIHENGLKVLKKQLYLWPLPDNKQETPRDMLWRVAYNVATAERQWGAAEEDVLGRAEQFYGFMCDGTFVANTPTLVNAGKEKGQLAACFVLGIPDSTDGIYETLRAAAMVQTSGGGTGFSSYRLRCKDSLVGTTGKRSGGSNSTLRLYDQSSERFITQGSARKGANMWVTPIWHFDVLEFIDIKRYDLNHLLDRVDEVMVKGEGDFKLSADEMVFFRGATGIANFNISVGVPDAFMRAADAREPWDLIDPKDGRVIQTVNAGELMDRIVFNAWQRAEPGMLFLDAANRDNPTPQIGPLMATNPCGEQWLLDDEACTLGHINLARFVHTHHDELQPPTMDWDGLEKAIRLAVRFLDNVIEINYYPLPQIERMHKFGNRKIGQGFLGLADALIKMDIAYDSPDAREFASNLSAFHERISDDESVRLAHSRGAFPNWKGSALEKKFPQGIRNACRRTWAPTGSTSIVIPRGPASSGCEPIFGLVMLRNQAGMTMYEVNPTLEWYMNEILGLLPDEKNEVLSYIAKRGTVRGAPWLPERATKLFAQANEVSMEGHVLMQAALQRHVDNAISKTINLAADASIEDVRRAYWLAWSSGCKGITVYRDKSRVGQTLNLVSNTQIKEGKHQRYEFQAAAGISTPGTTTIPDAAQANATIEQIEDQRYMQIIDDAIAKLKEEPLPPKPAKWKNKKLMEVCPNCQSTNVDHGSGCFTCVECGTSAC